MKVGKEHTDQKATYQIDSQCTERKGMDNMSVDHTVDKHSQCSTDGSAASDCNDGDGTHGLSPLASSHAYLQTTSLLPFLHRQ